MAEEPKKISRDTYLKSLALYTIAAARYADLRAFERQIGVELGMEDEDGNAGRISDSLYQEEPFDRALKVAGFVVEKETK